MLREVDEVWFDLTWFEAHIAEAFIQRNVGEGVWACEELETANLNRSPVLYVTNESGTDPASLMIGNNGDAPDMADIAVHPHADRTDDAVAQYGFEHELGFEDSSYLIERFSERGQKGRTVQLSFGYVRSSLQRE